MTLMKILIIDDNAKKIQKIRSSIIKKFPHLEDHIETAPDLRNAKMFITDRKFDVIIVDIQIPERLGDDIKLKGGLEFVQGIKRRKARYKHPDTIIGLTEFESNFSELQNEFSYEAHALIQYGENSDAWSNTLLQHIEYHMDVKKIEAPAIDYDYDVAIVCAIKDIEEKAVTNILDSLQEEYSSELELNYFTGLFSEGDKKLRVVVACTEQMGMVPASVLALKLIIKFRPKNIICSGILAGVKDEVNLGDIVIADPCWDYGSGKYFNSLTESKFAQEANQIRISPGLKNSALSLVHDQNFLDQVKRNWMFDAPQTSLKGYIAPVATGASVVADANFLEDIKNQNRKLKGIDMESYGIYYAAMHSFLPKPNYISIKSVSDFGDETKGNEYQKYAAYTSASFIKQYCLKYLY